VRFALVAVAILGLTVWANPATSAAAEPAIELEEGDRDLVSYAQFRGVDLEVAR